MLQPWEAKSHPGKPPMRSCVSAQDPWGRNLLSTSWTSVPQGRLCRCWEPGEDSPILDN